MSKFHGAKAGYEAGKQFLKKLFGKKSKVSPDIKSVKPNLTKTVTDTKTDEYRKRYTALDKSEGKIKTGRQMMREGQKERKKMVGTGRAFQFKGGSYHAVKPGEKPEIKYKGLLKEQKAKGGRVGLKRGTPFKKETNVEKIKKTFGPKQKPQSRMTRKKKFPDLTGDGKVTFADILKGRGVINGKKKKKVI